MTDPDLSIGSPADIAHRAEIDRERLAALRSALALTEAATGLLDIDDAHRIAKGLFPYKGPPHDDGQISRIKVRAALQGDQNAATDLIKHELPGKWWSVGERPDGSCIGMVEEHRADGATPALALLSAFLRALIAEAEKETADAE